MTQVRDSVFQELRNQFDSRDEYLSSLELHQFAVGCRERLAALERELTKSKAKTVAIRKQRDHWGVKVGQLFSQVKLANMERDEALSDRNAALDALEASRED